MRGRFEGIGTRLKPERVKNLDSPRVWTFKISHLSRVGDTL